MHELNPDQQRLAAIEIRQAAINSLPSNEVTGVSYGYEDDSCTIRSGYREVALDVDCANDVWGITARTWDTKTDEITDLRIYPGDVEEPVEIVEVLVNADRHIVRGLSSYIRPSAQEHESANNPNISRALSSKDVVVVTQTIPRDQFDVTISQSLRYMLLAPNLFRDLAPRRVEYYDPKLAAEEAQERQQPVEVLGPIRHQTLAERVADALRSLVNRALGQ